MWGNKTYLEAIDIFPILLMHVFQMSCQARIFRFLGLQPGHKISLKKNGYKSQNIFPSNIRTYYYKPKYR